MAKMFTILMISAAVVAILAILVLVVALIVSKHKARKAAKSAKPSNPDPNPDPAPAPALDAERELLNKQMDVLSKKQKRLALRDTLDKQNETVRTAEETRDAAKVEADNMYKLYMAAIVELGKVKAANPKKDELEAAELAADLALSELQKANADLEKKEAMLETAVKLQKAKNEELKSLESEIQALEDEITIIEKKIDKK